LRSTEDALTSIIWKDDSRIADQHVKKIFGDRPGAYITVRQIEYATSAAPRIESAAAPLFAKVVA
jgi:hypothetical protein